MRPTITADKITILILFLQYRSHFSLFSIQRASIYTCERLNLFTLTHGRKQNKTSDTEELAQRAKLKVQFKLISCFISSGVQNVPKGPKECF